MEELKEVFLSLGYTEGEYRKIVNTYPLTNLKPEILLSKVKEVYNFLLELGYTKIVIVKMTKSSPKTYSYRIENMKQKIEDLKALGYTQEEVIKITKSSPSIYGYSIKNIKQKIEDIKVLGYTQEEVIKMTKYFPAIYDLSIGNIKQKIEDIKALGYTQEEVIKMTINLPAIFGLNIENIKQKENFYNSIGLSFVLIVNTKDLMQSTKLSYARYNFYKVRGMTIDRENYRKLFMRQKEFERQYGITKVELLKMYPYPEEKEQVSRNEEVGYVEETEIVGEPKEVGKLREETKEEQKDVEGKDEITEFLKSLLKEKNGQTQKE